MFGVASKEVRRQGQGRGVGEGGGVVVGGKEAGVEVAVGGNLVLVGLVLSWRTGAGRAGYAVLWACVSFIAMLGRAGDWDGVVVMLMGGLLTLAMAEMKRELPAREGVKDKVTAERIDKVPLRARVVGSGLCSRIGTLADLSDFVRRSWVFGTRREVNVTVPGIPHAHGCPPRHVTVLPVTVTPPLLTGRLDTPRREMLVQGGPSSLFDSTSSIINRCRS